jgi:hypothetical protein
MCCPADAKIFNSNANKLEPKTVSCYFIGYPEKSKSFRFYYPDRHTKHVETRHVIFLEYEMMRGALCLKKLALKRSGSMYPLL